MTVMRKGYPTVTHNAPRIWPSVMGAILLLFGIAAPAAAQSYTIMPTPFQAPLNDAGAIIVGGCVWTYAAGTTTQISTYTNTSGTTNSNPIVIDSTGRFTAYLLTGTTYKFVYETACTPPAHGAVLRTADNIAGVPAAASTVDVTGTAGETISAGQCAYLSDGSGSKVAGQYYKCDSSNAYSSSTAILVGLAPNTITSGTSGTIRTAGSVSALTALSPGVDFYAGSSGALTSTQPTNARAVGSADSTTSLIVKANPGLPNADNGTDDFRLTLTTATPVTTADVTAATTIYCTPYRGNRIALFDAAGNATVRTSTEFSIAVPATTSQMYDVFAYSNSGVPTLELLAWTNDTTRATAIVQTTTGAYTKSGDLTRRYLGSFRTTTVSGQTEDSLAKRFLWNYYNRVRRDVRVLEATDSWTYTLLAFHQANASTANQIAVVVGVAEVSLSLQVRARASSNGTTAINAVVAIGEDSTTTAATGCLMDAMNIGHVANFALGTGAQLNRYPAVGYHFYAWLESSTATNVTTWYGDNGSPTLIQTGLIGAIEG